MGLSGAGRRQLAVHAAGRRRHHVPHAAAERRRRARRRVTGRAFWIYRYTPDPDRIVCCGANNRGLGDSGRHAVHGNARRAADRDRREDRARRSGRPRSRDEIRLLDHARAAGREGQGDRRRGGGEYGIRGFIAAYDARDGKEAWRFYTIPGPGEPGHETWERCPPRPRPSAIPRRGSTAAVRSG